ncbi:hypothetical protein [Parasegetibacter sp. NRK P23]|uniref:hypothetical protein n=1 Tax=Parasegetibacter sp. NRK P23 TaxID=2942999 RepID=UPI0020432668|nr:hypothetical protein [Parasegetibacter sp. NRK P23]MCM5529824.1 hypothetical protein [Parasegetibacter sp. NRK P23]
MRYTLLFVLLATFSQCLPTASVNDQPIDRQKVVERHNIQLTSADTLASLTVGNGKFAFTTDVTGLQTFPEAYKNGIPLGTQSEWGWHSFPNVMGLKREESLQEYDLNGRKITYLVQRKSPERSKAASNYFRENPHRLQLGNLGFVLLKKDGTEATLKDITNIQQELELWNGTIHSVFRVENEQVEVWTNAHGEHDAIGVKVVSPLLEQGRMRVKLRFPLPTAKWNDEGVYYGEPEKHTSFIHKAKPGRIVHTLDTTTYFADLNWEGNATLENPSAHDFRLKPAPKDTFSFTCRFSRDSTTKKELSFSTISVSSAKAWADFWQSGGAIDFEGSTDTRAHELERRIMLSQYLTRVQCAGSFPPQETGLTANSWYGKPHLEMHWWHGVHFALWGRPELLERSMDWYTKVMPTARAIAERQGFNGVRWQKMTDNNGDECPSSVGAFLVWQQPHFITFAELLYRAGEKKETLEKYSDLVFATADFMASFPYYDSLKSRFMLGKGLIPAQERFPAVETFNPTYELAYWRWALETAQQWKERLGMRPDESWNRVLDELSALPVQKNVYLAAESAPDSYTKPEYMTDHPSVLGAYGMLPLTKGLDTAVMRNTFNLVWDTWQWNDTWGWDFPMTAMTAARLGMPERAVDALMMDIRTNTYLPNGHNFQDNRLRIYLPGNGGLLAAIAMMTAGFDNNKTDRPGFPQNGKWKVKWEKMAKMF